MKKIVGICLLGVLLSACAHHRDVRQSADGVHKVVVQSEDTQQGSRAAIDQANHFCKQRGQQAAIVSEEQKYSGNMDEKTYKNAKTVSNVAKAAGTAVWVFGGKKESRVGGVTAVGGTIVDEALGAGYTIEMKFKCM